MSMTEKTPAVNASEPIQAKRTFILTVLCLISFTYFGLMLSLVLLSLFYSGSFRELVNTYIQGDPVTGPVFFLLLFLLLVLYSAAFTGTVLIWKMKRKGYFLFGIPVLLLTFYQLIQADIPILSTAILIFLLIGFGVFYRKLH